MLRSLLRFRRLLATTFLVAFVNMCLAPCWCAAMAAPLVIASKASTAPGCQKHRTAASSIQEGATANDQQVAADHDCCKGKSIAKHTLLPSGGEKHAFTQAPALLPETTNAFFRPAAGRWDRMAAVVLVSRQVLPPKIPDIRIFIRSLTI